MFIKVYGKLVAKFNNYIECLEGFRPLRLIRKYMGSVLNFPGRLWIQIWCIIDNFDCTKNNEHWADILIFTSYANYRPMSRTACDGFLLSNNSNRILNSHRTTSKQKSDWRRGSRMERILRETRSSWWCERRIFRRPRCRLWRPSWQWWAPCWLSTISAYTSNIINKSNPIFSTKSSPTNPPPSRTGGTAELFAHRFFY